jgi:outer membrane protein
MNLQYVVKEKKGGKLSSMTREPGACIKKNKILIVFTVIFLIHSVTTYADVTKTLSLRECIEIALKKSPIITSSELDIEASKEALKGSKGAQFPKLDLNASYLHENRPFPYIQAEGTTLPAITSPDIYAWALALRMPIYQGGRLSNQVKISELENMIQNSRRDFSRQDVISNVTNAFNKVLQIKELRRASEKSVAVLDRQRENTELFLKAGRSPKVELLRIEVQFASEKQNLIRSEEASNRARYNLAYLMGVDGRELPDIAGSLTADEKVESKEIEAVIKNRPDIIAVIQKVEQAKTRIDVASGRKYPSLDVIVNYGTKSGATIPDGKTVWEAGLLASINLFDAGIISSDIAREKILQRRVEEELRQMKLKARLEIDSALSLIKEAESKLAVSEKAVIQAEESMRIEDLKYKVGAGTITDMLLAESAQSLAQANHYQALYDYNSAITEYKRATGTIEVKK